jgi:hypothetical protein
MRVSVTSHCLVNHHVTGCLVFVLVSTEWLMMCPAIDNPTSCEIRALIRFLRAKSMSSAEIHRESCATIYSHNVMSEGTVRQLCRLFKDGRTNVHDEDRSGRPAISSEWWMILFKVLTKKFVKDGASQFQNFRVNFHRFCALFCAVLSQLG